MYIIPSLFFYNKPILIDLPGVNALQPLAISPKYVLFCAPPGGGNTAVFAFGVPPGVDVEAIRLDFLVVAVLLVGRASVDFRAFVALTAGEASLPDAPARERSCRGASRPVSSSSSFPD